MKYITATRIRWWISAFFQIALFAAAFLPMIRIIKIEQNYVDIDVVSKSAVWYLSSAGYPGIYAVTFFLYSILTLPLIWISFKKDLKHSAVLTAAISDTVYMIVNILWVMFVLILGLSGDFASSANLTVWFWVYVVVQTLQIAHLFILFFNMKKK